MGDIAEAYGKNHALGILTVLLRNGGRLVLHYIVPPKPA